MKKLDHWLIERGMKKRHFAELCGIRPNELSHFSKGRRRATLEFVCNAYDLTDGEITSHDWLEVYKNS